MKKKLSREQTFHLILQYDFDFSGYKPVHEYYGEEWKPIYDLTIGDLIEAIQGFQEVCEFTIYTNVDANENRFNEVHIEVESYELGTTWIEFKDSQDLIDNLYDCLCWCLEDLKGGDE